MKLRELQNTIRRLEHKYRRPPESVRLLAVSKTHPATRIAATAAAGQRDFGENYLQEALAKINALNDPRLVWHFIGPVQSNKTRPIAQHFSWVHSLDRGKIAARLNRHRQMTTLPPLNVLIQVNLGGERSKSGIAPDALMEFASQFHQWPCLRLRGLMSLPRPYTDFDAQRLQHRTLKQLFDTLIEDGYKLDTLSMGTSADMEAAIAEGTTLLRIGTALFGSRDHAGDESNTG